MDFFAFLDLICCMGHKSIVLLRSLRPWFRRPRGRYSRRFRLRLPRWLYKLKSGLVDFLVIVGGAALMAALWSFFFCT